MGKKIPYIYHSHPKPWSMNAGELLEEELTPEGVIKVTFEVTREQASQLERWDPEGDRVMIEVIDAKGRTVMENWLNLIGLPHIKKTLCLKDPNAIF